MDLAGVAWVLAASVAVLLPTLLHGVYLGSYDWISQFGLSQQHGATVQHSFAGDQITQLIPWTNLAWSQVHHGQLPLWNSYSALGTPLAFNWQSSAFSMPALIGYLVPMRLAYTVQILVTVFVAGSGVYVFGRVLRLNVMACALAGTAFVLSGSFVGWIGWPVASVMSWAGWILAAVVLVSRGRHRFRSVLFLSLTLAGAILAGQPDTLVLMAIFVTVFGVALVLAQSLTQGGRVDLTRKLIDLGAGVLAGIGLGAPLLLPGLQLASTSIRSTGGGAFNAQHALPVDLLVQQVLPGINGLPFTFRHIYIGVIVVVLAVIGSVYHWRRNEVKALVAVAAASLLLTVFQPAIAVVNALPGLKSVRLPRSISFSDFALALLAGVGLDAFLRLAHRRSVRQAAGYGFLAVGIITFVLWVAYPYNDRYRAGGLFWAGAGSVAGLVAVGMMTFAVRGDRAHEAPSSRDPAGTPMAPSSAADVPGPSDGGVASATSSSDGSGVMGPESGTHRVRAVTLWAGALLLVVETLFLVMAGETTWSSSTTPLPTNPAVRQLQLAVGTSTVGFGQPLCFSSYLGIPINANILFGVHQFAVYDPMLPSAFYTSWKASTGRPAGYPGFSHYCPGFISADEARQYGVQFVLEPHGSPGPTGAEFDQEIADEDLYRIPRAAFATLTPSPSASGFPSAAADGVPVAVTHTSPRSMRLVTDSPAVQTLRLHLAAVPGWRATVDGHPLALVTYSGVMLQADLPPGRHVVVLSYLPNTFTLGLALAAGSVVGLAIGFVAALTRRRRAGAP
jgi:hypothetical protein